jgi:hypothetical protein
MGTESADVELAAAQLAQEISQTHAAIMAMHKFAADHADPDVQLSCMKAAARMMQVQANAAMSLKRLRGEEARYAFRYIHEGVPPTPKKSKTNSPARVEEEWEDAPKIEEGSVEVWDVEPRP